MEIFYGIINFLCSLALAPLLLGVIARVKAVVAGRRGPPLLQLYYDLYKLLQKGAVYSRTTTPLFFIGPIIGMSAMLLAATLLPIGKTPSPLSFAGDLLLFVYLLGLARVFTIIAALDTGSSFEGMGASREAHYAILAEVALMLCLCAIARKTGSTELSVMFSKITLLSWGKHGEVLFLMFMALLIILMVENCRIPFDDPTTHLELTMIHEVMVLDHSGPDLAIILYTASLKLWLFCLICAQILLPFTTHNALLDAVLMLLGILIIAVIVGLVESLMARIRLLKVPDLLLSACALSTLALLASLR